MSNHYLDYITDEHLLTCIAKLYDSYLNAKKNISKTTFYKNKVDTFKLTFDAKFNQVSQEDLIESEVYRQIDKSINNAIGTFHEDILGGIKGYEIGVSSGFDIKAVDNTLFADIKNKHNTMNSSSSEALFQKLARLADDHKESKCYWVQILAKGSFEELWTGEINGKEYSHSRVYKISGDQFYALLTGEREAFFKLYKALPEAIDDYLKSINQTNGQEENSALDEIEKESRNSNRTILDQITFDNFYYYDGFDKL